MVYSYLLTLIHREIVYYYIHICVVEIYSTTSLEYNDSNLFLFFINYELFLVTSDDN